MTDPIDPGSFRDPHGFIFRRDGVLYRQVNPPHREDYDHFMASGLYEALAGAGLLIPHHEVDVELAATPGAYKVLRPEPVDFVSYPYEWSFTMLKDAALATLRIQKTALDFGMSLRDASAYNIQFHRGRALLIDTLSFEKLREAPWVAYRQLCEHFLAPLALMSYRDARLGQLLRIHLDGVPLDFAASLLPLQARFRPSLLMHVFLHARAQRRYERPGSGTRVERRGLGVRALKGLVDSLEGAVSALNWEWDAPASVWTNYYTESGSYSAEALEHKRELVAKMVEEVAPASVWDLGGNVGLFARIASDRGIPTVCFDADHACVDANYRRVTADGEVNLLPLVLDLTNPSPPLGWDNRERRSLAERGPADLVMALALVHHLAIGSNVPLGRLTSFLRQLCSWLLVEFVPKTDPRVRGLLSHRDDVFPDYTREGFERAFERWFTLERSEPLAGSERSLYLMRGK